MYEFYQVRSNALMAAGRRDPNESIEAIRTRLKRPDGYNDLKQEEREIARLQDGVADQDAAINEMRKKIEFGLEAVQRARLQDDIPRKMKKHFLPYQEALKEGKRLRERQAALGPQDPRTPRQGLQRGRSSGPD